MKNNEWTFNNNEDGNWCNDCFESKEEAIKAGIEYAKEEGWNSLYVGQTQEIPVVSPMDADTTLERAAEMIDDNYGGEYEPGESFLSNIERDDSDRLQELLDEAFNKWVTERDIKCPCFILENIVEISID